MPIDEGWQAINDKRHLLVLAVDKEIRALLAGRGLPFAILVGDEKMQQIALSTNCTALPMVRPMVEAVAEYFRSGIQLPGNGELKLLTDPHRRKP